MWCVVCVVKLCCDGIVMRGDVLLDCSVVWYRPLCC